MDIKNITQDLNDEQRKAAGHINGPLLIIAGAGAGKTKTLVSRITHLIATGVAPEEILAITFTNKAAGEMRERVLASIKENRSINTPISIETTPFVSTFHALGVHILKANADKLSIPKHFSIYGRGDSKKAVRESLKDVGYDPKQYDPGKILGVISRIKGEAMGVGEFREKETNSPFQKVVISAWERYDALLKKEGALDFDDLLLKTLQILEGDKDVREFYQNRWKFIHIDEYQDTNHVQYRIAGILAKKHSNICVVGDVDQTIYSWRGAQIKIILTFEKDYPEAEIITLEENYRSTKVIIEAANQVIDKNQYRRKKTLYTNNSKGDPITVVGFGNEISEAAFIAEKASELINDGLPAEEVAVLYRTNVQSRVLEEAMLKNSVPYQVLGTRFFERKEVKDVISYIKVALNPSSITDFKRIVNTPTRGIGKVTMLRMIEHKDNELGPRQRAAAEDFRSILEKIRLKAQDTKPSELIRFVISQSGIDASLKKEGTEDAEERRLNIYELASLAERYDRQGIEEGLEALLTDAALASDQDQLSENKAGVKLMTVHAAKGLEFNHVFITGLEEGLFPQSRDEPEEQEEERRLFYVALTRGRKKLYLTRADSRVVFGRQELREPSVFLDDIDESLIDKDYLENVVETGLLDGEPVRRIEW